MVSSNGGFKQLVFGHPITLALALSFLLIGCPDEDVTPKSPAPPPPLVEGPGGGDDATSQPNSASRSDSSSSNEGGGSSPTIDFYNKPNHRLKNCVYKGPAPVENEIRHLTPDQKELIIDYVVCVLPEGQYLGLTDSGRECSLTLGPRPARPEEFLISLEVKRDPPRIGGTILYQLNSSSAIGLTLLEKSEDRISLQLRRDDRWMGSTGFDLLIDLDSLGYVESVFLYDQSGISEQLSRASCELLKYEGESEDPLVASKIPLGE